MRKVINTQAQIFRPGISNIKFNLKSRDEIPKILIGLQAIYNDAKTREAIFGILPEILPKGVDPNNGRKGMDLWQIFVLGTLRLGCNIDYDKLQELANEHSSLRKMLGIDEYGLAKKYGLQTIKDNVSLFTPEILDKINSVAVAFGHRIAGHNSGDELKGSCDSFVVETNVHFPTDINMLFDAVRTTIEKAGKLCGDLGLGGWREAKSNVAKVKAKMRKASRMKRSTSKKEEKKAQQIQAIKDAHEEYVDYSQSFIDNAKAIIDMIDLKTDPLLQARVFQIKSALNYGFRLTGQIRRRVLEGETIPHHEKIFSIFEDHTEWVSKGKAGVPVELGIKVCVLRDQYGFILNHRVMQLETDDKVAVPIIFETKQIFVDIRSCSFDKGFHSPANQIQLAEILDKVFLPRKGKLSGAAKEIEYADDFKEARRKHSAVESSINALENSGLDKCLDHGLHGFKRYVALGVLARNIHTLGHMVQQKALKRQRRAQAAALKALPLAA